MTKNVVPQGAESVPLWAQLGVSFGAVILLCVIFHLSFSTMTTPKWQSAQPVTSVPITTKKEENATPVVRSTPPVSQPTTTQPTPRSENYVIRPGDTLSRIATELCTTIEQILDTNSGNPAIKSRDFIIAGKSLTINKGEKCASPESVERKVHPEKSIVAGGTSRAEFFVVPPLAKSPTTSFRKPVFLHDCDAVAAHASGRIVIKGWSPTTKQVLDCIETRYGDLIREAARSVGLDPNLIKAVVYVESKGDSFAVSPSGCLGLMQLLRSTAGMYRVDLNRIYDPRENIFGGARVLAHYLRSYARGDIDWALAAYNLGPTGVSRRISSAGFVPSEASYVRAVRSALTLQR